MLELVVVLPVLILLAIGVIEFGRVYYTSLAVANAARAGAEWGARSSVNASSTAGIAGFTQLDGAQSGPLTIDSIRNVCRCDAGIVSCTSSCGAYGEPRGYVVVGASKVVPFLMKYPGIPASIKVSRTATFRYQ